MRSRNWLVVVAAVALNLNAHPRLDLFPRPTSSYPHLSPVQPDPATNPLAQAERAALLDPTPGHWLALAQALDWAATVEPSGSHRLELLARAYNLAARAVAAAKAPDALMYYTLGDIQLDRGSVSEAHSALTHALALHPADLPRALIPSDLILIADRGDQPAQAVAWFSDLAATGHATAEDWAVQARRLERLDQLGDAGAAWEQAATLDAAHWERWCAAAADYARAPDSRTPSMRDAQTCIRLGDEQPGSAPILALAHSFLAEALTEHGLYAEALLHARQSAAFNPAYSGALDDETVALLGLRLFPEAIDSARAALRISSRPSARLYFHYGVACFDTGKFQSAGQSFEHAAQLDPSDDAAAYNAGLSLEQSGNPGSAARWYQEALRRNPNRPDRDGLLRRIRSLDH